MDIVLKDVDLNNENSGLQEEKNCNQSIIESEEHLTTKKNKYRKDTDVQRVCL